jgi:hypothetical protein
MLHFRFVFQVFPTPTKKSLSVILCIVGGGLSILALSAVDPESLDAAAHFFGVVIANTISVVKQ